MYYAICRGNWQRFFFYFWVMLEIASSMSIQGCILISLVTKFLCWRLQYLKNVFTPPSTTYRKQPLTPTQKLIPPPPFSRKELFFNFFVSFFGDYLLGSCYLIYIFVFSINTSSHVTVEVQPANSLAWVLFNFFLSNHYICYLFTDFFANCNV